MRWLQTIARTFTSVSTNLHLPRRTGATVFFSCPCPIHSGSAPETSSRRILTALWRTSLVRPLVAQRRPLSRADLFEPLSLSVKNRRTMASCLVRRCVTETGQNPSPLSSLPRARHHPSARKRVRHCLAAALAGRSPTPTCGPLPDWAFEPPGRPDPRHRKYHSRPPQSFPA